MKVTLVAMLLMVDLDARKSLELDTFLIGIYPENSKTLCKKQILM